MIAFAGEQRLGFQIGDIRFRVAQLAIQLFQQVIALLSVGFFQRQVDIRIQVAGQRREFVIRRDLIFGALAIPQNGLRGFLVAPEIGLGNFGFERLQAFAVRSGVKDNSEPSRCAA